MHQPDFNQIFEGQVDICREMLVDKRNEYASDHDVLINFKNGALVNRNTPKQTLKGYLTKHIVSIYDMIDAEEVSSLEKWDEKLTDAINYLILLKALVIEETFPDDHKLVNPLPAKVTNNRRFREDVVEAHNGSPFGVIIGGRITDV